MISSSTNAIIASIDAMFSSYPYDVFIDSDYSLRVLQYHDDSEFVSVDEYYYNEDKYDDD